MQHVSFCVLNLNLADVWRYSFVSYFACILIKWIQLPLSPVHPMVSTEIPDFLEEDLRVPIFGGTGQREPKGKLCARSALCSHLLLLPTCLPRRMFWGGSLSLLLILKVVVPMILRKETVGNLLLKRMLSENPKQVSSYHLTLSLCKQ